MNQILLDLRSGQCDTAVTRFMVLKLQQLWLTLVLLKTGIVRQYLLWDSLFVLLTCDLCFVRYESRWIINSTRYCRWLNSNIWIWLFYHFFNLKDLQMVWWNLCCMMDWMYLSILFQLIQKVFGIQKLLVLRELLKWLLLWESREHLEH